MPRTIFITLPVADVARATAFYTAIGFSKNETFSGEQSSAMIWSDAIHVMLSRPAMFASLTDKTVVDPRTHTGALFAIGLDSREEVDAINRAAIAAGGRELHGAEDEGFMYSRAFEDPDGNGWGPFFMDIAANRAGLSVSELA